MKLRALSAHLWLILVLLAPGCATGPDPSAQSHRAHVQINGVSPARVQEIIVRHMKELGYRQLDAAPGFLVMERPSGQPVPGMPNLAATRSKIQIAIQELQPGSLTIHAIEYAVFQSGTKLEQREAAGNEVFMQGLLEGFKAKALYGDPTQPQ